jgi:hypothetical protein
MDRLPDDECRDGIVGYESMVLIERNAGLRTRSFNSGNRRGSESPRTELPRQSPGR